jgi:hypothetical protein
LADELRTRIAEHTFGLGVDQRDGSARVDDDSGIGSRFDERSKLTLGPLAVGHVANGDGNGGTRPALDRAQADLGGELRTVLTQREQVDARAHRPWVGTPQIAATMLGVRRPKALGDEHLHLRTEKIFARVAE